MEERIRQHIDTLLAGTPNTHRVAELRDEMVASCLDKYADLTAKGILPDDAYDAVVAGIGDVDEVLRQVIVQDLRDPLTEQRNAQRRAMFITLGVALYVMSIAAFFLFDTFFGNAIAMANMLAICAIATGLIVYGSLTTRTTGGPNEPRNEWVPSACDDTAAPAGKEGQTPLMRAASSSLWSIVVILYLLISFLTHAWHISWTIFLLGGLAQNALAFFLGNPRTRKASIQSSLWLFTTALYFLISFTTRRWDMTWIIFLVAVAVSQMVRLYQVWRNTNE